MIGDNLEEYVTTLSFVREAEAYCKAVEDFGLMDSRTLAQFARLRNIYDGKPVDGKWAKWAEAQDRKQGIIP